MQSSEAEHRFIAYSNLQSQNVLSASALDVGVAGWMRSPKGGTEDKRQGLLETVPSEHGG